MKKLLITVATGALAPPNAGVLQSLPTNVQQQIKDVRAGCSGKRITKGDEGLKRFTINGSSAVLANTYCGTGDTYSVDIYVNGKKRSQLGHLDLPD
jgi:hypothetical protein